MHKVVHRPHLPLRHAATQAKAGITMVCRYAPVAMAAAGTVVPSSALPGASQSAPPAPHVAAQPAALGTFYPPQYVGTYGGFWPVARVSSQPTQPQSTTTTDTASSPTNGGTPDSTSPEPILVPPPVITNPPEIVAPKETTPVPVPEPSSLGMLAAAVMLLMLRPRRRN